MDKVVDAIEGGPALAFGDKLEPGSLVSAWVAKSLLSDAILVLNIQEFESRKGNETLPHYVVIVVVPSDLRDELVAASIKQDLAFSVNP